MDISVLLARGRSSYLPLLLIGLIACTENNSGKLTLLQFDKARVTSAKGITYYDSLPLTGILYSLNESGDTLSLVPYRNGKENGSSRYYYQSGKPKSIRAYVNGWKQGEHVGWFEDGAKQFVFHFVDDKFEGNQKEWLANGQLYSDLNYVAGIERGSQRVWNPDGTIKTNYIIINNRRYGLLGTKNCVNVVDSVFRR